MNYKIRMKNAQPKTDKRVRWAEARKASGKCITCGKGAIAATSHRYCDACLDVRHEKYCLRVGKQIGPRRIYTKLHKIV